MPPPGAGGFSRLVTADSPWSSTALPHAVSPPSAEICAAVKLFWQVCLALSSAESVWVTGAGGLEAGLLGAWRGQRAAASAAAAGPAVPAVDPVEPGVTRVPGVPAADGVDPPRVADPERTGWARGRW